jgi:copper chaperone
MSSSLVETTLVAPGISCGHCVATVEGALKKTQGIANVEANAETKQVVVTFDPSTVTEKEIKAVMESAGYPVAR